MAEYIDRKGLISKIQLKTGCNFSTANEIVESFPTADVVERSKLNKAIEEITEKVQEDKLDYERFCSTEPDEERARQAKLAYITGAKILRILKKT